MVNFVVSMECSRCGYAYRDDTGRLFVPDTSRVGSRVRWEGEPPCGCAGAEYVLKEVKHVDPAVPYMGATA